MAAQPTSTAKTAGAAKVAVASLRRQLTEAGFEETESTLEMEFGTVVLQKEGQTITLSYVDTGVLPPEVTIRASGAALEVKK